MLRNNNIVLNQNITISNISSQTSLWPSNPPDPPGCQISMFVEKKCWVKPPVGCSLYDLKCGGAGRTGHTVVGREGVTLLNDKGDY